MILLHVSLEFNKLKNLSLILLKQSTIQYFITQKAKKQSGSFKCARHIFVYQMLAPNDTIHKCKICIQNFQNESVLTLKKTCCHPQ